MAEITMRPYQETALQRIEASMEMGGCRDLLVLPTGCGKTTVFADLVRRRNILRRCPVLVIAHRMELLEQGAERIRRMNPGLRVGIEGGDRRAHPDCDVVVAGIQSIGKADSTRLAWLRPELVIIDEAHHACADSYQNVLERFGAYEGRCYVLGVTATPHRLDNKPLHGSAEAIFESVVFSYTLREAISQGYLCGLRGYRVASGVDLSGVKTTAGDFNQAQLQSKLNTKAVNDLAFRSWQDCAADRRTIVFCTGVAHARELADLFVERGVPAASVSGDMPTETRTNVMEDFRSGRIQVLTNMELVTEGVDVPEVAAVLMLRPTQSWALYTQCIGRGLRLSEGKEDCVVIDVVGNSEKHNLASVPAILGLPPKMDLEGKSVMQALDVFEGLDEGTQAALFARPTSFTGLTATLTAVDLLQELSVPEEISAVSKFNWLKIGDDRYRLDCGGTDTEKKRTAFLSCDPLGEWTLTLKSSVREITEAVGNELEKALQAADRLIRSTFADAAAVASTSARWRVDRPTESQLKWLRKKKVSEEVIARMNKGQASAMLSQLFDKGGRK